MPAIALAEEVVLARMGLAEEVVLAEVGLARHAPSHQPATRVLQLLPP